MGAEKLHRSRARDLRHPRAILKEPRVLAGIVWGTRWMDDREAARNVFYAFGPSNEIMPTGRAIELWGRFLRQRIVASAGGGELVSSYAGTSSMRSLWSSGSSTVACPARDLSIAVTSPVRSSMARAVCFSGKGPDDISPTWSEAGSYGVGGNRLAGLTAPGTSVTVVEFSPDLRRSAEI